ncbi:hypothetical protein GGG16DRAFT_85198 [Schizophyllum commune]
MALANAVPGFLKLPLELMHEIVADVDAHADLMAIALTCRSFAHLIIPGHLEYRIIRVRHPLSSMWHHLAKRRDLARNIREVHFCDRNDYSDSDRWPKRLVEGTPTTDEVTRIKNICTALHHMEKLVVFTWTSMERHAGPTQCPLHEDAILQALCGKPSLQRLAVIGNLGTHAVGTNLDPKSVVYPLWRVNNLTSIILSGDAFLKPANGPHVRAMLNRSSSTLEHLECPLELQVLQDCKFTNLRRLKLRLLSGASVSIDRSRIQFLANNPSIEELAWIPLGCIQMPPNILPNLRSVQTTVEVLRSLCKSETPRAFEVLEVLSLDAETLIGMENLDRGTLKKLTLSWFDNMGQLERIAELFPNLTWLNLPRSGTATTPDQWLSLLPRFRHLEVLRGQVLWESVGRTPARDAAHTTGPQEPSIQPYPVTKPSTPAESKARMHTLICQLAIACPHLEFLDHCVYYDKRRDWQRIAIMRKLDEKGVLNVRYEIRRPQAVKPFTSLGGVSDATL